MSECSVEKGSKCPWKVIGVGRRRKCTNWETRQFCHAAVGLCEHTHTANLPFLTCMRLHRQQRVPDPEGVWP
jgi:hypothetical protein